VPLTVDTLVAAAGAVAATLHTYPPLWGLLGVKSTDIAFGVVKAIATRQLDPGALRKGPLDVFLHIAVVFLCLCLMAISSDFSLICGAILIGVVGADLLSITRNWAAICQAMGEPAPDWLDKVSGFLKAMPNTGVNSTLASLQPAVAAVQPAAEPASAADPTPADSAPAAEPAPSIPDNG
jgi:hypothetical protein